MPLFRRKQHRPATLTAIYIAAHAGAPVQEMDSAQADSGAGLRGDRYAGKAGFWKATDACQVTLISTDDLDRAARGQGAQTRDRLAHGQHRRNLVIDGLKTKQLEGKRFRIGTAVFAYDKPRPPCGYLDQIEGRGLCKALGRHAGVCIRVLTGGRLAVGDVVEIIENPD
jgi:MOSC domain-containing protein YiiM